VAKEDAGLGAKQEKKTRKTHNSIEREYTPRNGKEGPTPWGLEEQE